MKRRISKKIFLGDVPVGGDSPITVQSMTKTDTRDVKSTINQIMELVQSGCEIVRCAVPDMEAAKALKEIKRLSPIPVVADIHFHYELALESLKSGVDCLRLNPGNIRDKDKVTIVVNEAKTRETPIRIGVNFGSLPPVGGIGVSKGISRHNDGVNLLSKGVIDNEYSVVDHMVQTGLWEIGILEDLDFDLIKISLKAFDIDTTVEAYRKMAKLVPYPLHLGITESGTAKSGSIRSSIGLGILLYEGIGDTIRVSLSDDPTEEIYTGFEILKSLGIRSRGVNIISCPSCARQAFPVIETVKELEKRLSHITKPINLSIIGCVVNGPGEAAQTEIGLTGGGQDSNLLYLSGIPHSKVASSEIINKVVELVEEKVKDLN